MTLPILPTSPTPSQGVATAGHDTGHADQDRFGDVLAQERGRTRSTNGSADDAPRAAHGAKQAHRGDGHRAAGKTRQDQADAADALQAVLQGTGLGLIQAAAQHADAVGEHIGGRAAAAPSRNDAARRAEPAAALAGGEPLTEGGRSAESADDRAAAGRRVDAAAIAMADAKAERPVRNAPGAGQRAAADPHAASPRGRAATHDARTPEGRTVRLANAAPIAATADASPRAVDSSDPRAPHQSIDALRAADATAQAPGGAPGGLATLLHTGTADAGASGTVTVSTPLNQPQWAQDFSTRIVQLAQADLGGAGGHRVQMQLNPPDLGPVHVTLHVQDQIAQASFISPHANVRQALENALPQLAQQLAQAGLSLGQADVGSQQPGAGQPGSGFAHAASQSANGAGGVALGGVGGAATDAAGPLAATPRARPDLLVDTFA